MQDLEGDRDPSHLLVACNQFHRRHNDPFLRALVPNAIPRSSAVEMLPLLCQFHALKSLWMKLSAPLAVTVPLTDSLSLPLSLSVLLPRVLASFSFVAFLFYSRTTEWRVGRTLSTADKSRNFAM